MVASLIPIPPGNPDKTPAIPDNIYVYIAFCIEIEFGAKRITNSHKINASDVQKTTLTNNALKELSKKILLRFNLLIIAK